MKRRHFLYLGSSSLLVQSLLASPAPAAVPTSLQYLVMQSVSYKPVTSAGDYLMVDSSITHFAGEGLYLYPDWGCPVPYLVRQAGGSTLAFCHPASGAEIWRQTQAPAFAGRLEKIVAAHDTAGIRQLQQQLRPLALKPAV